MACKPQPLRIAPGESPPGPRERWKRVDRAVRDGKSLPPVELYKLGEEYFVVDGNHRVSVARHRGMPAIEALVTEISMPRGY